MINKPPGWSYPVVFSAAAAVILNVGQLSVLVRNRDVLVRDPGRLAAARLLLRQPGVSSVGAGTTRPEQVTENAAASGRTIDEAALKRVDEVLGDLVDRGPGKTAQMMAVKPDWMRTAH
ncbi:hypothetical protein GCM10010466_15190 [Planomonospora alba]|uniref:Uncharacterized protein n=1 Tax=Planomonospora alba TaxID=161354 RepID=A0ABP6MT81_9ACTN